METTKVYFVRHAQPNFKWIDDLTRPLTSEGEQDKKIVLDFFKEKNITVDEFYCSPYKRSVDTIKETAKFFRKEIKKDFRLREREKGPDGNTHGMFEKRWADFDLHEEGGESLRMVEMRNVEALQEILQENQGKTIVIGTHGTALSTIFHHYNPEFGCKDFLRIIDWMPYVVEMDFEKDKLLRITEWCHIEKEFKGNNRADKRH